MSQFVRFEVRFHVGDLHISLVRFQLARIHRVRILDYDYILRTESLGVKILESRKYLRELRQSWLLVHEFLTGKIAESRTVETNSEVRTEDAFASQLLYARVCLVKFTKKKYPKTHFIKITSKHALHQS